MTASPSYLLPRSAGGGPPALQIVRSWDQGSTGVVAMANAASGVTAGGFDCDAGILDVTVDGITQYDGYTEAVPYVSVDFSSLPGMSNFDYEAEWLVVEIDVLLLSLSTVETGIGVGVLDLVPGASALGAAAMVRDGSGSAHNTGLVNATGGVFSSAGAAVEKLHLLFQWSYSGTAWSTRVTGDALRADGNTDPGAAFGSGQAPTVGPTSSKFVLFLVHGSTDDQGPRSVQAQVKVGRVKRPTFSRAAPAREDKPATGPGSIFRIYVAGDSIVGDGQGGQTRTGTLPAWLSWYDNGVALTDYPNTSPVPQTGLLGQLAEEAHDAGYESVEIFVRALSAQEAPVVGGYARLVNSDGRTLEGPPDLFCIGTGTNDSQSQAEADGWAHNIEQLCIAYGICYPGVRCLIFEPPVVYPGPSSGHLFVDVVKAYAASIAAAHPDLIAVVSSVGLDLGVDSVHLLNTGYDEFGLRGWTTYEGM